MVTARAWRIGELLQAGGTDTANPLRLFQSVTFPSRNLGWDKSSARVTLKEDSTVFPIASKLPTRFFTRFPCSSSLFEQQDLHSSVLTCKIFLMYQKKALKGKNFDG